MPCAPVPRPDRFDSHAEDMLESIANAIPVEGMESLMPALVDHLEPVGSMLPKHAVVLLSDPEKLRRSAEDLAKTANEFLAASWHVAASGHGAGAPSASTKPVSLTMWRPSVRLNIQSIR